MTNPPNEPHPKKTPMPTIDACHRCGKRFDAFTCATTPGATPDPGDVSICWGCAAPRIFTAIGWRAATPDEETRITTNPKIRDLIHAIRESYTPAEAIQLYQQVQP